MVKFLAIIDHGLAHAPNQHPVLPYLTYLTHLTHLTLVAGASSLHSRLNILSFPASLTSQSPLRTLLPLMADAKTTELMEKIVSLCKRRGFIFQSSEIYGG